ncbi:DUF1127 domain-containing protein [Novispirillum sp. DQ9]|uniref:DUF1127 domain-containing protein n=1 Tax=Novispirillum sp. DQ9 TaxID=3398612 RepID=UPI003C7B12C0
MNRTCHVAPGQARSVSLPTFQAKEILKRAEAALIAASDRLFAALDRDRERTALGRLDDRALKDLGLSPGARDRF